MSYRIQYSPELEKRYPTDSKQKRGAVPLLAIIAFLLIIYIAIGTNVIDALLPANDAVAVSAFSGLVESVESGNSIKKALLDFCHKIITSGT